MRIGGEKGMRDGKKRREERRKEKVDVEGGE